MVDWKMGGTANPSRGGSSLVKFGRNMDVDALAAPEDIWQGGGLYTGFPTGAAETLTIVSSSTADAAAGTGMRRMRILGLDANGRERTEDVNLNGTTPVVTTSTWTRVYRAFGVLGGSGQTNAGTVTVRHTTTAANVFVSMAPGLGSSLIAGFTVPANRLAVITHYSVTASNNQQTAQEATVGIAMRQPGSSFWRITMPTIVSTSGGSDVRMEAGLAIPARTDVMVRVLSATADNLAVTALIEAFVMSAGAPS